MSRVIYSVLFFGCISIFIYELLLYYQQRASPANRKIKVLRKGLKREEHILDKIARILMPIIKRVPKRQTITLFIQRAGNPYHLDFNRYVVIKMIGVFAMYYVGPKSSPVMLTIYILIGLFGVDLMLMAKKKARQAAIMKELPFMMSKIARSTGNGIPIRDVLMVLSTRLEGPLKEEVGRLSVHYNIDGNLSKCLPLFASRIGMDEVDNICMAMIQSEQSGKMRAILEKQAEILKRRTGFAAFKSTKNRSNFLPLTTVGMVICIFILVVVPMFLEIATNGLFK